MPTRAESVAQRRLARHHRAQRAGRCSLRNLNTKEAEGKGWGAPRNVVAVSICAIGAVRSGT
jgi:hypothetical protein